MMIDERLEQVLADQEGLLSLRQAGELGLSRSAVRSAGAGRWQAVLPQVVSTSTGPLSGRQRLIAALLHAGPGSMISSLTAAAWHGVTAAADSRVHVLLPPGRRAASTGFVVVHRTGRPGPGPWHRGPLAIAPPARAVVDAARDCPAPAAAVAILCEAIERRTVTVAQAHRELESGPTAGTARARAALVAAEASAWSVAQIDLRRLGRRASDLPPMRHQPVLTAADGARLPSPDGWFDDVGLAVQVRSWRWPAGPDRPDGTVMTDGVFAEYGVLVVAVTPTEIRRTPGPVLARIRRAYRAARYRRRPEISATRPALRCSA